MPNPVTDFLIDITLQEMMVTKSGFSGEESYVRLLDYFLAISFLYEAGAILARTMVNQNRFSTFEKMLLPDDSSNEFWQGMAKERLIRFRKRFKKEPYTFQEFIFERLVQITTGLHPYDAWEIARHTKDEVLKKYDKKIPIRLGGNQPTLPAAEEMQAEIRWFVTEGIGFGSYFTELTKKMNDKYWESVRLDTDRLSERYSKGYVTVDVPELIILSLEEQEKAVTQAIAYWAKECFPELLEPLGLGNYDYLSGYETWKLLDDYRRRWLHLVWAVADIDCLHGLPY